MTRRSGIVDSVARRFSTPISNEPATYWNSTELFGCFLFYDSLIRACRRLAIQNRRIGAEHVGTSLPIHFMRETPSAWITHGVSGSGQNNAHEAVSPAARGVLVFAVRRTQTTCSADATDRPC